VVDVQIGNNMRFTIDGKELPYSLYYFDSEDYNAPSSSESFKKILGKCTNALQKISSVNSPMFLPFAPEDEEVECLKATVDGDKIVLTIVEVNENGYAVDWTEIEVFITSPQEIRNESAEVFGVYNRDDIVSGLMNARVNIN
jgi:hypothetical protein